MLNNGSGNLSLRSTGPNSSQIGTFTFTASPAGTGAVNVLYSDTSGNWTMPDNLTVGSLGTTGAATVGTLASSGAITQGGTAVCLSNGTNCPSSSGYSLGGAVTTSNVTLGAGAGTGASIVSVSGFDKSHSIIFQAGNQSAAFALPIYTLTYTTPRSSAAFCVNNITIHNAPGLPDTIVHYAAVPNSASTTTSYQMSNYDGTLVNGYQYQINVSCP
jgi:hypothetical protein